MLRICPIKNMNGIHRTEMNRLELDLELVEQCALTVSARVCIGLSALFLQLRAASLPPSAPTLCPVDLQHLWTPSTWWTLPVWATHLPPHQCQCYSPFKPLRRRRSELVMNDLNICLGMCEARAGALTHSVACWVSGSYRRGYDFESLPGRVFFIFFWFIEQEKPFTLSHSLQVKISSCPIATALQYCPFQCVCVSNRRLQRLVFCVWCWWKC